MRASRAQRVPVIRSGSARITCEHGSEASDPLAPMDEETRPGVGLETEDIASHSQMVLGNQSLRLGKVGEVTDAETLHLPS